jgi:hypothetical protein
MKLSDLVILNAYLVGFFRLSGELYNDDKKTRDAIS